MTIKEVNRGFKGVDPIVVFLSDREPTKKELRDAGYDARILGSQRSATETGKIATWAFVSNVKPVKE